jgi:hypothetical protein
MTFNGSTLVRAVVVLFVVALVCLFVGGTLAPMLNAPPVTAIGAFFAKWAWPFGIVAGAWYYFSRA